VKASPPERHADVFLSSRITVDEATAPIHSPTEIGKDEYGHIASILRTKTKDGCSLNLEPDESMQLASGSSWYCFHRDGKPEVPSQILFTRQIMILAAH
jgi:hypothetical protein